MSWPIGRWTLLTWAWLKFQGQNKILRCWSFFVLNSSDHPFLSIFVCPILTYPYPHVTPVALLWERSSQGARPSIEHDLQLQLHGSIHARQHIWIDVRRAHHRWGRWGRWGRLGRLGRLGPEIFFIWGLASSVSVRDFLPKEFRCHQRWHLQNHHGHSAGLAECDFPIAGIGIVALRLIIQHDKHEHHEISSEQQMFLGWSREDGYAPDVSYTVTVTSLVPTLGRDTTGPSGHLTVCYGTSPFFLDFWIFLIGTSW